jgi:hypothetical protein
MTQQYDNTNRGVLFRNDRKQQDNHPDHTGTININGVEYWLSAWIKSGANGRFFSLAVKPKDQQAATTAKPAPKPAAAEPQDQFNDDIPF